MIRAPRIRMSALAGLVVATALAATPVAAGKPTPSFAPFACGGTAQLLGDPTYWPFVQIGVVWTNVKVTRAMSSVTSPEAVPADVLTRSATFPASSKITSWVGFHWPLRYLNAGDWAPTYIDTYRLQLWNGKALVYDLAWSDDSDPQIPVC